MIADMTSQSSSGSGEPTVVFSDPALESRASRRFGPVAVGAALILALATFVIFAGFSPIIPTQGIVLSILAGDGLVTFSLLILIGLELRKLRAARRAARAGARLHSRVVALFALVAAIPALVTAVVATVSVEWAINPAFMKNVADFINESAAVFATLPGIAMPVAAARRGAHRRRSRAERTSVARRPEPVSDLLERTIARAEFRGRGDHHLGRPASRARPRAPTPS